MNNKPEISIIMSVYNGESYLAEAIESVINQSFKKWELIIINDCSNDSTPQILESFANKDERIKVHTNEINLRLPSSLNKAISLAEGKYVARMDADDICIIDRFEKQYKFMEENPSVDISSCRFMTLKNGIVASGGGGGKGNNETVKALLAVTNPILHPGLIAKAEVMRQLKYNPEFTCTEDMEIWTRAVKNNYKIEIQPEYLMIYRLHDKQITSTTRERQKNEVIKIQREYLSKLIAPIDESMEEFYINGIYFRILPDINKFINFYRFCKTENNKKNNIGRAELDYAFFEILAEYKRCNVKKTDIIKAILCFNPVFIIKELKDRKKRAVKDGMKCVEAAKKAGYKHTSGTLEFPVFSKE